MVVAEVTDMELTEKAVRSISRAVWAKTATLVAAETLTATHTAKATVIKPKTTILLEATMAAMKPRPASRESTSRGISPHTDTAIKDTTPDPTGISRTSMTNQQATRLRTQALHSNTSSNNSNKTASPANTPMLTMQLTASNTMLLKLPEDKTITMQMLPNITSNSRPTTQPKAGQQGTNRRKVNKQLLQLLSNRKHTTTTTSSIMHNTTRASNHLPATRANNHSRQLETDHKEQELNHLKRGSSNIALTKMCEYSNQIRMMIKRRMKRVRLVIERLTETKIESSKLTLTITREAVSPSSRR